MLALYCYLNLITVASIHLQPTNKNNYAYMPIINRPTSRQALYLTTIITITGTVLPPGQTAAMLTADSNLTIAAPACS